jgi:hypothetical protein
MDKIDDSRFQLLPNKKKHVSFSELRQWCECSWRHKVQFIDGIDLSTPGTALDFGTSIHAAHEQFINTRVMSPEISTQSIDKLWLEHSHGPAIKGQFINESNAILAEVPSFYDVTFPGWESTSAEHFLYEPVGNGDHAFKGYIDAIITAPGPRNKKLTWIIDVKTTSWGWDREKKENELTRMQIVLYKKFWSLKTGTDPKDVRCAFLLLKRAAKTNNRCELFTISAGDKTMDRAMKRVTSMLNGMKKGIAIKNRYSCIYCPYKDTKWCT